MIHSSSLYRQHNEFYASRFLSYLNLLKGSVDRKFDFFLLTSPN